MDFGILIVMSDTKAAEKKSEKSEKSIKLFPQDADKVIMSAKENEMENKVNLGALKIHNLMVVQSIKGWKFEDTLQAMEDAAKGIRYNKNNHKLGKKD